MSPVGDTQPQVPEPEDTQHEQDPGQREGNDACDQRELSDLPERVSVEQQAAQDLAPNRACA
jgi:hypothetical protein